ncbi:MAG: type II toxin-antitoxin system RelE/ParE family toxin [Thermoleophilia bacterium]
MTSSIFRPAAAADVEDAFLWYESQRSGLGDEYLDELDLVLRVIAEHPNRFPIIHRDTRRALLHRFPYAIFYRVLDKRIIIVACMHGKRNPAHWQIRR